MKKILIISILLVILLTGCGNKNNKVICANTNETDYLKTDLKIEINFNNENTKVTSIEKSMKVKITDIDYILNECSKDDALECVKELAENSRKSSCETNNYSKCETENITENGFTIKAEVKMGEDVINEIKMNQSKESLIKEMKEKKNVECE